jgi:hypothetical protein
VKVPARRKDASFFLDVKQRILRCDGVISVDTNPVTASILIAHVTDVEAIARYAQQHGLFRLAIGSPITMHAELSRSMKSLDGDLKAISNGSFDLTSTLFATLLGLGIYQAAQGEVMVPAITFFWYAYDTLRGRNSNARNRSAPVETPADTQ